MRSSPSNNLSGTEGSSGVGFRSRKLAISCPYLIDSARRKRMRPDEREVEKSVANGVESGSCELTH